MNRVVWNGCVCLSVDSSVANVIALAMPSWSVVSSRYPGLWFKYEHVARAVYTTGVKELLPPELRDLPIPPASVTVIKLEDWKRELDKQTQRNEVKKENRRLGI